MTIADPYKLIKSVPAHDTKLFSFTSAIADITPCSLDEREHSRVGSGTGSHDELERSDTNGFKCPTDRGRQVNAT